MFISVGVGIFHAFRGIWSDFHGNNSKSDCNLGMAGMDRLYFVYGMCAFIHRISLYVVWVSEANTRVLITTRVNTSDLEYISEFTVFVRQTLHDCTYLPDHSVP